MRISDGTLKHQYPYNCSTINHRAAKYIIEMIYTEMSTSGDLATLR